tara:strand:- start:522 stop:1676 length:1155 start_codon:yes stop_codon:yes gene_type:complete
VIIRQFKLIRKIQLTIVSICLSIGSVYADSIGDIVESTGIGKIVRQNEDINVSGTMPIVLYDRAETAMGSMLIEFIDKAELALKEHTEVYIDEIYYDPDPNLSKMSMRMVMGTARFASGSKGLINKANIDIQTPTATIGIRGTDFTTTIDELGRSLIVLLPDINGDPSGEISVSNMAGTVILNQPYQATMVSTMDSNPTSPVTINGLTPSMIDNMFIVNPPSEVKQAIEEQAKDDQDQDTGMLDVDFLEFNELESDALADSEEDLEFSELDIDLLDVDFLRDLLDVVEALEKTRVVLADVQASAGGSLSGFRLKGAQVGFNKDSQFNVFEQDGNLVFFRSVNGVINIIIGAGGSGFIDVATNDYEGLMQFNDGDGIEIFIRQVN